MMWRRWFVFSPRRNRATCRGNWWGWTPGCTLLRERHIPSWPGLSRPSTSFLLLHHEDVDARDKPGHDDLGHYRLAGSEITRLATSLCQMKSITSAPVDAVIKPAP